MMYYGKNRYRYSKEERAEMQAYQDHLNEEQEEYLSQNVSWTSTSCQEIVICTRMGGNFQTVYLVSIDGKERTYSEIQMISDVPGIVAKVGNIGLTQEHYDALLAIR